MSRAATVTVAQIKRAIRAAEESGLTVHGCVMAEKEVRLIFQPLDGKKTPDKTDAPKPWPELAP